MGIVKNDSSDSSISVTGNYSLKDMKSLFYIMNAKPDTTSQLLFEKKKIGLAEIRDLNERIQRKLQNHTLVAQIASINIILDKGVILDYKNWSEFEQERWETINHKSNFISMVWDLSIKVERYKNPQRHTLKLKIGNEISPKDIFDLMLTNDNMSELLEKHSNGVVKVDFIDQVLAGELIKQVTDWYEGLEKVKSNNFIVTWLKRKENLISAVIHNFTPILMLVLFYNYHNQLCYNKLISSEVSLSNIQLLIISIFTVFMIGNLIGRKLTKWFSSKVDDFEDFNQFNLTNGDKKSLAHNQKDNYGIIRDILIKTCGGVISYVLVLYAKKIIEFFQ